VSSSSTPIYGFPYPNGDDSLSNLANRIQELAYYIEYTYDTLGIILSSSAAFIQTGTAAGGVLSGTYPNPDFAVDMATQAELSAHTGSSTSVHGISNTASLVYTSDSRLSNARTPTTHASSHASAGSDPLTLSPSQITGTAVITTDSRLSDARTPTTHASSHGSGGSDQITIAPSQVTGTAVITTDSRLSDSRTPTSHASTHASAGSDPITIANTQVTGLGTASTKNAPSTGNASSTEVVLGSDTRLTNSRTPSTHASTHVPGGSDEIDLTKIVALSGSFPTLPNSLYPAGSLLAYGASAPYTLYRSTGSAWDQVGASSSGSTPSGPAGGDLTGTYPNPTLAAAGTSGTYTKITTDSKGRVTSGTTLSATDIPTLTLAKISDAGTSASKNVPATGNAASGEVVLGSDTRLTDSRTPSGSAGGDLTGSYPNPTLAAVGTSGTYTKVTTDSKGRVTSGTTLAKTDIPTIDANQVTGTAITAADTGTVTNTMLAGSIADTKLSTISTAGKISNSATTATSANTASAIVARDSSGNFSAGTITATLSGNASTVTTNANLTGDVTSTGNTTTIASGAVTSAKLATAVSNALAPTGSMMMYAGSSAPSGWVLCDGTTYDGTSATYLALWGVVGTTYGGTGQSSFKVPDMRGNVPIGVKSTQTASPDVSALGKTGGAFTFTLTSNQIPTHTHSATGLTFTGSSVTSGAGSSHSHTIAHTHTVSPNIQVSQTSNVSTAAANVRVAYPSDSTVSNRVTDTGYNVTSGASSAANSGTESAHTHSVTAAGSIGGSTGNNTTTGSAVDNFQPFLAVNYIIKL